MTTIYALIYEILLFFFLEYAGELGRIAKCPNGLDTYQSTYRNFVLFIFLPVLHRYVSTAYPVRIRIGYVANLTYPCNVDWMKQGLNIKKEYSLYGPSPWKLQTHISIKIHIKYKTAPSILK
jgi:hypothetical protein